jgi:hypothetical protein
MVAANIDLGFGSKMTVADVMREFKVCRRTVENWFADGLAAARMGGRVYTTREAINDFREPYEVGSEPRTERAARSDAHAEASRRLGLN